MDPHRETRQVLGEVRLDGSGHHLSGLALLILGLQVEVAGVGEGLDLNDGKRLRRLAT